MKMNKINIVERSFLYIWPFTILVALLIYLITKETYFVTSYILGVVTVLLMQSLNYRVMKNLFQNSPSKIKKTTIWLYILRYLFYGVILYIVYNDPYKNIYFTLAGLVSFKIIITAVSLIFANKGDDLDD